MRRKRIIVCHAHVPFAKGGSEVLSQELVDHLNAAGQEATLVGIPYQWNPPEAHLQSCRLWGLVDLTRVDREPVDTVICTKFPTYLCHHPNKVVWLFHQYRPYTDRFGQPFGHPDTPAHRHYRQLILDMDRQSLSGAKKLFAISQNVAGRLRRFVGLESEVLYPPVQGEHLFHAGAYGDYVMQVCRLEADKRPDLLIAALAHCRTPVRAILVGSGSLEPYLRQAIHRHRVADRAEVRTSVPLPELISLYSTALAVFTAPVDEDYGLVTVEAFKARRPVVATSDAGGVLEFVTDGVTGLVVPPDPGAAGEALDRLYLDRAMCGRLGEQGHEAVREITWQHTMQRMLPFL